MNNRQATSDTGCAAGRHQNRGNNFGGVHDRNVGFPKPYASATLTATVSQYSLAFGDLVDWPTDRRIGRASLRKHLYSKRRNARSLLSNGSLQRSRWNLWYIHGLRWPDLTDSQHEFLWRATGNPDKRRQGNGKLWLPETPGRLQAAVEPSRVQQAGPASEVDEARPYDSLLYSCSLHY